MPNIITIKIDATLVDKKRLFPGRKKNKKDLTPQYLELVCLPTKPSNFGDYRDEQTHMVCQSVTKAERDAGVRGEILGNACERVGERDRRAPAAKPAAPVAGDEPPEDQEIPF